MIWEERMLQVFFFFFFLVSKLLFPAFFLSPDEPATRRRPVIVPQIRRHGNTRWVNTFLIEDAIKVNRLIILPTQKFLI